MPLKPLRLDKRHRRSKSQSLDLPNGSPSGPPSAPPSPRIVVHDAPLPPSILRAPSQPSSATTAAAPPSILSHNSHSTTDSQAASSIRIPRATTSGTSAASTFSRSDTVDSRWSAPDTDTQSSTPATSISSLGATHCPLPESSPSHEFPFFSMTLSSTSTLQFIALPVKYRPTVLDAINRAWRRGIRSSGHVDYAPELMQYHKRKGCDGGVWEVTMKNSCWNPRSEDKVSSKRIILNLITEFARVGYTVTSSYRTSAKDSGKDTLVFVHGPPDPDPVFFGVAFYGSDRIWLIDADQEVGTTLEDGIKAMWVDGVRDARVRERHAREIKLRGSPWVSHNQQALISSRIIHIVIRRLAALAGYEFCCSVCMSDTDEAEIPFTVYRLNHGRAVDAADALNALNIEPISAAAKKSMAVGR